MKTELRIIMVDPGITSDPTGIVGIRGVFKTNKIYVMLARQITEQNRTSRIAKTRKYLAELAAELKPDYMGIETNGYGKRVKTILQAKGVHLQGCTTNSTMTSEQTLSNMDKPDMILYMHEMQGRKNIIWPEHGKGHFAELQNQFHEITRYKTRNGTYTYQAANSHHDDLFMALLLCCHVFRVSRKAWWSVVR